MESITKNHTCNISLRFHEINDSMETGKILLLDHWVKLTPGHLIYICTFFNERGSNPPSNKQILHNSCHDVGAHYDSCCLELGNGQSRPDRTGPRSVIISTMFDLYQLKQRNRSSWLIHGGAGDKQVYT